MSVLETLEICFTANLAGVTSQLTGLSGQLRSLSADVTSAAGSMRPAGAQMMNALSQAIESGMPRIRSQGTASASTFVAGAQSGVSGARSAGAQLSAGMASGILSGRSRVTSAVSAVVNSALSRMRSMLDIHSPSRVTMGFGKFFGEGFASGIAGSAKHARLAADSLSRSALSGLGGLTLPELPEVRMDAGSMDRALSQVNLTVPLVVDGMKLGEASIRGINAVTKSAGKVLLNI